MTYSEQSVMQLGIQNAGSRIASVTELEDLIERCSERSLLEIKECTFYGSSGNQCDQQIKPNYSVEDLKIIDSKLSVSAIECLAKRLKALKTLLLTTTSDTFCEAQADEDYIEWWNHATQLCQSIEKCTISILSLNPDEYLQQFRSCTRFLSTLLQQQDHSSTTEFIINSKAYRPIQMKQNNASVGFSTPYSNFWEMVDFSQFYECIIELFSPGVIKICRGHGDEFGSNVFNDFNTLDRIISTEAWTIFDLATASTNRVVHLSKLVFSDDEDYYCAQNGPQELPKRTSVSELKLSNCRIQSSAFPKMSLRLPNVETLIIEDCVMNSYNIYKLEIDLRDTNVGVLQIILEIPWFIVITESGDLRQTFRYNFNIDAYQPSNDDYSDKTWSLSIKCKTCREFIIIVARNRQVSCVLKHSVL
ncbi:hypothetical protein [Parasitella parasitica]|uniref:Uncharacterized protein n=1 Tax=Parasitella parasitica TaxID=35722 RepID=A0A0B7N4L6_9FUNG|nr:hypothetical protein [Parasitella parasitica]